MMSCRPIFSPALRFATGLLGAMVFPAWASAQPKVASSVSTLKKMSIEELMGLEVTTVSRRPEKLLDAPSAIQVVTQEDMRRAGVTSVPEALRLADNLTVAQKNPHDWAITARGFNTELSNKLLVLMDGRTVYSPLFSGVFWNVQDYFLPDLERIEVVSGPGGTLWGANAMNGVINIITKSAKDTQGALMEFGGGHELPVFGGARFGGMIAPGVYYRIYGKYFERDNTVLANGTEAPDDWQMARGGFRIDSVAQPQNTFTLQGDIYNSSQSVLLGGPSKASGGNLLGRWTHTPGADSEVRLQLYYDRTHLVTPMAGNVFAPTGTLTDTLDTYDLDFQHRFRVSDRQEIVWGLGYRFTQDDVVNPSAGAFLPASLDRTLASGFVQDEIKIAPTLTLTLGSKLEHNDYTGFETEPNVRLLWTPTSEQTWWAAVSRAVRTPSRVDRDLYQPRPPLTTIVRGNDTFKSERVIAYELGYRAQLAAQLSASVSAFYNDYEDVRSLGFTPTTIIPLFFQNNLEGETHGFELTARYAVLDWWRLHAGYDLLREHLRIKPGRVDLNNALNETADPRYQFFLRSSMDLPGGAELDLAFRQIDSFVMNNSGVPATVGRYHELDARIGWHVTPEVEVMLVGQNLLHARHAEYGVPSPTREEVQRSIYAKILWRF